MASRLLQQFTLSVLFCIISASVSAETFYFTAIPDEDETKLIERFTKVADYLSEQLDVDARYIPVKSYAAAITAFRNNQIQLAWFGGLSGVQARRLVPGSEALAQGVEDAAFRTYFIANKSLGIEPAEELSDLEDQLRGKTFTFGSKGSTSGRLMPEFFLRETFNQAPEDFFSRVGFSGNHTRTIRLVESGTYQVGALNFQVWNKDIREGTIDTDSVEVIWETPTYPDYQWTIRGDVNERFGKDFKNRVKEALLNLDDPELLKSFPRSGFIPVTNDDYEPTRKTAEAIGILD